MSDPGRHLLRALAADAARAGVHLRDPAIDTVDWASATFVGHRHRIAFSAVGGAARAAWLARLPDAEWTLPGHVVVDLAVLDAADESVALSSLTLRVDAS